MSAHPVRTVLGASAAAGLGLWVGQGALDVTGSAAAPIRVAMLPPIPELVGLVGLMVIAASAATLLLQQAKHGLIGAGTLTWDPALSDALRLLFALALLILPYLPWLSDWVPALRVLAGPMRWLLCAVVLGQVVWIVVRRLAPRPHALAATNTRRASVAIFIASFAVYGTVSTHLSRTRFFPGGDEPHYLIVTQSLLRDGDLKIENNHQREDYREYFPVSLRPDYRTRGKDGQIYSIHPVGLPILVAPVFAVGGYRAVVWWLIALAACTATMMWRWTFALTGSARSATFGWAAVALSAPYVLNSFTVYPEIPAALCVMLVVSSIRPDRSQDPRRPNELDDEERRVAPIWPSALALAALPWLSTKYIGMTIVLAGALVWSHRRSTRAVLAIGPLMVSLIGWLGFFYSIWGSPLPSVVYGPDSQMSLLTFASGGPGLLFDQEYGIFAYAPILAVGLVGLAAMCRDRSLRFLGLTLTLVELALLALVGSFGLWWGGSGMPGRPMIAALPLLAAPIAWIYAGIATHSTKVAAAQVLLALSLAVTSAMTLAADGTLVAQGRDGIGSLLEWFSPTWHLWTAMPSYILSSPLAASSRALLWCGAAGFIVWVCRRTARTPGRAALRITVTTLIVSVVVASLASQLPGADKQPRLDPESRVSIAMLERFDSLARPVAVRYDPFSIIPASEIPPQFPLTAAPGQRLARQPTRVLLNARFRLPAGSYEVELTGAGLPEEGRQGTLGLQIGREGNPVRVWPLTLAPAVTWRQRFELPLDAEFVAFRATPDLERAVASLRLRPLEIVDAGHRAQLGPVISAASFGPVTIFFHEVDVYSEPGGFWVRGKSTMRATVVKDTAPGESFALELHSGARTNNVTLKTPRWSERVDLVANVTRTVEVPSASGKVVPLVITTTSGFVPAEVDPANSDQRFLGCWVAVRQ